MICCISVVTWYVNKSLTDYVPYRIEMMAFLFNVKIKIFVLKIDIFLFVLHCNIEKNGKSTLKL